MAAPPDKKLGTPEKRHTNRWVQTERAAHEQWAKLIARKPRAAQLLHELVAHMGNQNAVVVSQKTLSKMLGVHERTVRRAVSDLVNERWIQVVRLGSGKEAAYVVNDQVAWGQKRNSLSLSSFSAQVVANVDDQPPSTLEHMDLRRIPTLYPGEQQVPHGPPSEPPSQGEIEGTEHDLPTRDPNTFDVFSKKTDNED